jgi:signal transduction histidine kinase
MRRWLENSKLVAQRGQASGVDGLRMDDEVEANVYRLAQEALHNVYKHAGGSRVGVFFNAAAIGPYS